MSAVLFLDIDGVLNCEDFYRATRERTGRPARHLALCKDRMALLNGVIAASGCTVVVSSTWRRDTRCRDLLRRRGFKGRFHRDWRTDWLRCFEKPDLIRGDEIADWLERHPTERWAIVDDDSDMRPEQKSRFVQTSYKSGLMLGHVERLVELLS